MKITKDWLREKNACGGGAEWFDANFPNGGTMQKVIDALDRPDWLIWFAFRAWPLNRAQIIALALVSARRALKHVPKGEVRPLKCIETVEAYVKGEATLEDVREARRAAWSYWTYAAADAAAADAAAADADADAADAAADAADAWRSTYSQKLPVYRKEICDLLRAELRKKSFAKLDLIPFKKKETATH